MRSPSIFICLAAGIAFTTVLPCYPKLQAADRIAVIGYFTESGAKPGRYTVKDIATSGSARMLTELDYAFGRVAGDRCEIADPETALHHPYSSAESVNGQDDPTGPNDL